MARARDPNRNKAFDLWKHANGEIKLKEIADRLGYQKEPSEGGRQRIDGTIC